MGCTVSISTGAYGSAPRSKSLLLEGRLDVNSPSRDRSRSTESEKMSTAVENFVFDSYKHTDSAISIKTLLGNPQSRRALQLFCRSKQVEFPEAQDQEKDVSRNHFVNSNLLHSGIIFLSFVLQEPMFIDDSNAPNFFSSLVITLVDETTLNGARKPKKIVAQQDGTDELEPRKLATLNVGDFLNSPFYLMWRAQETAGAGAVAASSISNKSMRQHADQLLAHKKLCPDDKNVWDSDKEAASPHSSEVGPDSLLAESAFVVMRPEDINHLAMCSSWLSSFVAAAEGVPAALFLAACDHNAHPETHSNPHDDKPEEDNDHHRMTMVYLNAESALLFGLSRETVLKKTTKHLPDFNLIQHSLSESTSVDTGRTSSGSTSSSGGGGGSELHVIPPLRMTGKHSNGDIFDNFVCAKLILDQRDHCRFIVGIHKTCASVTRRAELRMMELMLETLPDHCNDDSSP